jgi:hypothetical protein
MYNQIQTKHRDNELGRKAKKKKIFKENNKKNKLDTRGLRITRIWKTRRGGGVLFASVLDRKWSRSGLVLSIYNEF